MKACAVIPAYNEEKRVAGVVRGALRHLPAAIVVDDGSSDGTARAAAAAGAALIRHGANRGKGAALETGLRRAFDDGFDAAVILDADGQHDPGEIPRFLEAAGSSGADIVVGNRMEERGRMPLVRYLTNRVTSFFVSRLAGRPIPDSQCGFRLVDRRAFDRMRLSTARYETESEMLIQAGRAGCAIASVPVRTIYGDEKSRINPLVDTLRFIRLTARYILSRKDNELSNHG
ncbi:MAG: glycosyltransferase family 2 protein [bacterium]|nr:glycosyltransferase family 2 protein [bacterium]